MNHLRAVPGVTAGPRDPSTPPPRSGSASSVRVEAPGKVNLFLSVGASGTDGYHQLTTVFQAVRLIETVTARRQSVRDRGTVTLTLEEPDADVPTDASNLAMRAAELLAETTGVSEGVDLLLRKRVPVAGGMAGGSADAAATLVACNILWGTGLSLLELSALAARLGADVPFPLTGATAVGSGRGDLVTPIMTRGSYHWVFALAGEGLSTPAVFRRFDELTGTGAPAVRDVPEALTSALRAGDAPALAASRRLSSSSRKSLICPMRRIVASASAQRKPQTGRARRPSAPAPPAAGVCAPAARPNRRLSTSGCARSLWPWPARRYPSSAPPACGLPWA